MANTAKMPKQVITMIPPMASLMGLPIELRLRVYDFILPTELNMFKPTRREKTCVIFRNGKPVSRILDVSYQVSEFRALFTTCHQMRSEILRYSLFHRTLNFNFTGGLNTIRMFGQQNTPSTTSIDWLLRLSPGDMGPCHRITVHITHGSARTLYSNRRINHSPEMRRLWRRFCRALPTSKRLEVTLSPRCCFTNSDFKCVHISRRTLYASINPNNGRLSAPFWVKCMIESMGSLENFQLKSVSNFRIGDKTKAISETVNEYIQ